MVFLDESETKPKDYYMGRKIKASLISRVQLQFSDTKNGDETRHTSSLIMNISFKSLFPLKGSTLLYQDAIMWLRRDGRQEPPTRI